MKALALCLAVAAPSLAGAKTIALMDVAPAVAKGLPEGCIATAEVVGGEPLYAVAGHAEPDGVKAEKRVFEIGSITKVFTALLLAQAVVEKKLTLDSTVGELLRGKVKFADARLGAITMRQLATHTSGLPRMPDNVDGSTSPSDPYASYDRSKLDAYLSGAKLPKDLKHEPEYSNLGVGLLGDLLSRLYDKPWEQLVREKITGPLGMKDTVTATNLSEDQRARLAPPYAEKEKASSWHFISLAGAGALCSTLADMVVFGNALLDPQKTPFADAIALMLTPQEGDGVGLAIRLSKVDGQRFYEHNGGTGGYRSAFQVFPDQRIIRVVLINNSMLEPQTVINLSRGEKPRTKDSGRALSEAELAEYTGVYQLGQKARLTVVVSDKQLMSQITGQAFFKLFPHEDKDRFFLKVVAAETTFERENGKIVSATIHQNGHETKARRLEQAPPKITFHPVSELRRYEGTYKGEGDVEFTVAVRDATLFVKLRGQGFAPVFERKPNHWMYDVVDAAIEFEAGTSGAVNALVLHQNGGKVRAVKQ